MEKHLLRFLFDLTLIWALVFGLANLRAGSYLLEHGSMIDPSGGLRVAPSAAVIDYGSSIDPNGRHLISVCLAVPEPGGASNGSNSAAGTSRPPGDHGSMIDPDGFQSRLR